MARSAYVIDGCRTPFGKFRGGLSPLRTDDLAALPIAKLVARTGIEPEHIDDVIFGCANQAGEDNRNVARMALLLAGLPVTVPGVTVNRLCGSGMQAINDAARLIQSGEADLIIAGGVEHMTRAPLVMAKPDAAFPRGDMTAYDTTLGWRFVNPKLTAQYETLGMGQTAERVAARHGVSREAQDAFAVASQQRAGAARDRGFFDDEVFAVQVGVDRKTKEPKIVAHDEHPRPDVTAERLAKLKTVFQADGTVTAGNASGLNDGAAAVLVASEVAIKKFNLTPLARYITSATAGVEPSYMGLGPIPASQKAMKRAGLTSGQIEVAELNEAFAAQAIPCTRELGLDPENVNVNGGAIAIGHPLGASGTRITLTLMRAMVERKAKIGLASMCIGVGQGIAVLLESAR